MYTRRLFAGGTSVNSTQCAHPFEYVAAGVPTDFPSESLVGNLGTKVRPSIMESFTTHNPAVCLFDDDYEALMTLYPVCSAVPAKPRCEKSDRNIGLLRLEAYAVLPLLMALLVSIVLHICVERQQKALAKKKEEAGKDARARWSKVNADLKARMRNAGKKVLPPKKDEAAAQPALSAAPSAVAAIASAATTRSEEQLVEHELVEQP